MKKYDELIEPAEECFALGILFMRRYEKLKGWLDDPMMKSAARKLIDDPYFVCLFDEAQVDELPGMGLDQWLEHWLEMARETDEYSKRLCEERGRPYNQIEEENETIEYVLNTINEYARSVRMRIDHIDDAILSYEEHVKAKCSEYQSEFSR